MVGAGDLYHTISFSKPEEISDGQGGTVNGWAHQFRTRAHYRYLRGGETVQAARLEGRQPVIITVLASSNTRRASVEWLITDARTGTEYNIRAITPTDDRAFLEILAESGVAV